MKINTSDGAVELHMGFAGGSEYFNKINFLKTPGQNDCLRSSRSRQLSSFLRIL